MRERAYRNRPVVGCHPAERAARHERRGCAEIGAAQRRRRACRSGADDDEVHVAGRHRSLVPSMKLPPSVSVREYDVPCARVTPPSGFARSTAELTPP